MIYLHFVCTLLHFTQIENICRIQKISGLQPTELEGVTLQIREMDNDRVERDVGETGFIFFLVGGLIDGKCPLFLLC